MHNVLFQAICRTGIFMICAQTIAHFRPNESYEKYLKLLVSVMVLIQLFLPIGAFLAGVDTSSGAESINEFRESLNQSMEEARELAAETEVLLEQMTLEEVRRRMEEQTALEQQAVQEAPEQGEDLQTDSGEPVGAETIQEGIEPVELPMIDVEITPMGTDSD